MRILAAAALAAITTFIVAPPAQAATYNVVTNLSSLTVDANANGGAFNFSAQVPGSDTANFTGTLEATVTGGPANPTITFNPGSYVDALANPNAFVPTIGGAVPSEVSGPLAGGDYIFADGSIDPTGTGDGVFTNGENNFALIGDVPITAIVTAVRNYAVGFGGSGIANDGNDDAFTYGAVDGWFAIDLGGFGIVFNAEERVELTAVGDGTTANISGDLGYSLVGNLETITIPVNVAYPGGGGAFEQIWQGTIVAERTIPTVIPEPASGLFLASLVVGAGAVVRRRRK